MNIETLEYVKEKSEELIAAPSCCPEAKAAAEAWMDAVGMPEQDEETKKYIKELEEDVMPIEQLIAFAGSEGGIAVFGKEGAKNMEEHARKLQAEGEQYCDCAACQAALDILAKKMDMLY